MSTLTTFIQLSFCSPIQIHQAIKRKSRYPNLKGRGKIDTISRLKNESVSHSVVSCLFVTPRTISHQAPLSMGFSRQEYWSGLPFLPPGDLPNPGIEPASYRWTTGEASYCVILTCHQKIPAYLFRIFLFLLLLGFLTLSMIRIPIFPIFAHRQKMDLSCIFDVYIL